MNAREYLKILQRHEEYYNWFLAFAINDNGDIGKLPRELQNQLSFLGIPIDKTSFYQLVEEEDWAKNAFNALYDFLPEQMKRTLKLGEDLAIGSVYSSEFNGAVLPVKNGKGAVIVLPIGIMLFLNNVATQITIHASNNLCRTIISGGLDRCNITESLAIRLWRKVTNLQKRKIQNQFPIVEAAEEFDYLIQGYFDLGVTIPINIIRKYQPVPLIGNPLRAGHPLECGAWLEHFSYQFLLLHEFAHVTLNHSESTEISQEVRKGQEFDADKLALKTAIEISKTENWKFASCIGAWVFLLVAKWLERLEKKLQNYSVSTHPPADERLVALRQTLAEKSLVNKNVFKVLEEIESLFEKYWLKSEYIRNRTEGHTRLSNLLSISVFDNKPELFKDQIPRWLLFGAPTKLCIELARLRRQLENNFIKYPDDTSNQEKLNLVMWVYETAANHNNTSLINELNYAYNNANNGELLNGNK